MISQRDNNELYANQCIYEPTINEYLSNFWFLKTQNLIWFTFINLFKVQSIYLFNETFSVNMGGGVKPFTWIRHPLVSDKLCINILSMHEIPFARMIRLSHITYHIEEMRLFYFLKLKTTSIHKCFLCPYKRQTSLLRLIALRGHLRTWQIFNTGKTLYLVIEAVYKTVSVSGVHDTYRLRSVHPPIEYFLLYSTWHLMFCLQVI